MLYPLESRVLFAVTFSNGVLTVVGTSVNDAINVSMTNSQVSVLMNNTASGPYANVKSIVLQAGDGADSIKLDAVTVPARIYAGMGNDWVISTGGTHVIFGEDGNDTLYAGTGKNSVFGGRGNDSIQLTEGSAAYVDGQAGSDGLTFYAATPVAVTLNLKQPAYGAAWVFSGTGGNAAGQSSFLSTENIFGSIHDDTMKVVVPKGALYRNYVPGGGAWQSQYSVESTRGMLFGGYGNDKMIADTDDPVDTLFYVNGGIGDDRIDATASSAKFVAGFAGGDGNDVLKGGSERDHMFGQAGNDALFGGSGNDLLEGGDGDDYIEGNASEDDLYGGQGNDTLDGGSAGDRIYGDGGNDVIYARGGYGDYDWIYGGEGRDRAQYDDAANYGREMVIDSIEVRIA